jgi:hypothetical protein
MIVERFDDKSHDFRQRKRIIFRRVWDKRWIVHVVYTNHFRVFFDFFDDHFEMLKSIRKIFNFSIFDVYLIINVKTDFNVIFRFV